MFKRIILTFLGCAFFVGLFVFPKASPCEMVVGTGMRSEKGQLCSQETEEAQMWAQVGEEQLSPPPPLFLQRPHAVFISRWRQQQ